MTDSETKTCRFCAEPIRRPARVCPHCRLWQTVWSLHNPLVTVTLVFGCVGAMGLVVLGMLNQTFKPKPDFSAYQDQIVVTSSRMAVPATNRTNRISLIGTVTNQSPIGWKSVELDCRYFDADHRLIDAKSGYLSGTILGHDERAFRIDLDPAYPLGDYSSYQVTVRFARNGKSAF